jgi:hypothetical protein
MAVRKPVPQNSQLTVEYVPLEDLQKWPTNPKEHDLGAIAASMLKHGFRDPIGANKANHNYIEEGHGRLDTLMALKRQGRPAPRFIVTRDDGTWLVPVLFFDDDEMMQRSYMIAHNRTQDLGGGYDDAKLLEELEAQANFGLLPGTGFDGDDVEALRRKVSGDPTGTQAQNQRLDMQYKIIVECESEMQQTELLDRFQEEGLTVKALIT